MCGIAGLFQTDRKIDANVLLAMTESVRHRGPDDSGSKLFDAGGIGNRRLSIIDLETGRQPICNEDESIWITFNGEIYNFQELTRELKKAGHQFRTKSDTEVLVHGYEQWGTSLFKNLRGMFAFAIVDLRKRIVILARDHFGMKPLFFLKTENTFAFASELQQFQQIKDFEFTIDPSAIHEYLWLAYISAPRTIFRSIYKLHPAHFLTYSFSGKMSEQQEYWQIHLDRKQNKSESEWLEELDSALKKSVEAHLIADVETGVLLSGGIDSTLLTSYAKEFSKHRIKTFSIGFQEEGYDETPYARIVSETFQTEHHIEFLKPESLQVLPELVKHYGEPYGDNSCLAAYRVCQLAKEHVKVAISGEGGDECFLGYRKYGKWIREMENVPLDPIQSLRHFMEKYLSIDYRGRFTLRNWLVYKQQFDPEIRKKLWKTENSDRLDQNLPEFEYLVAELKKLSPANRLQYIDLKTYLPNLLLVKMDIAGMIHGLEIRTPFVDKDIWELAASIPENLQFKVGKGKTFEGKLLLTKLVSRNFDDSFVHRGKHGFLIPLNHWFSNDRASRDFVQSQLFSSSSRVLNYFDRQAIQELFSEGQYERIWQLLFLEEWLRFFDANHHEPVQHGAQC
jgi:asparagine synthase (glutamine-hydrolysing)